MAVSLDLLMNAVISGPAARRVLCRGVGRRGDLLRHARHRQHRPSGLHPARLLRGLHRQHRVRHRPDPGRGRSCCRPSTCSAWRLYQVYYVAFERRDDQSLRGLSFFFGMLFITEVALVLIFGVDYRTVQAPYIGPSLQSRPVRSAVAPAGAVPGRDGRWWSACSSSCRAPSSAAPSRRWRRTSRRCG